MEDLCIKAGKNIYEKIKDAGLDFDSVTTFVGPAAGPRWLISSGFDKTFLKKGLLGRSRPVLLTGSSAGALRFAAWTQPEPEKCYQQLLESYISMTFSKKNTPQGIMQVLLDMINTYIDDDAIPFALKNKNYRLAITAARAKHIASFDMAWLQALGVGSCFLFNILHRSLIQNFFQRVVFYNGPIPPQFCRNSSYKGIAILLNAANFKHVLLASSAIPMVVPGVRDIYDAPKGVYRDGGLTDYHLNQRYQHNERDITLLFHHQERIIPAWLDKKLKFRRTSAANLENILMIHPSASFIEKLPGGKLPDRSDFKTFRNDPLTRIKNWWQVVEQSASLGEQFLELVVSGKIRHIIKEI